MNFIIYWRQASIDILEHGELCISNRMPSTGSVCITVYITF